jgi:hypothetical protein
VRESIQLASRNKQRAICELSSPAQAGDPVLTKLDGGDTAQKTRLWLLDAPPSRGMTIQEDSTMS